MYKRGLLTLSLAALTVSCLSVPMPAFAVADMTMTNIDCRKAPEILDDAQRMGVYTAYTGEIERIVLPSVIDREKGTSMMLKVQAACGTDPKMKAMAAKAASDMDERLKQMEMSAPAPAASPELLSGPKSRALFTLPSRRDRQWIAFKAKYCSKHAPAQSGFKRRFMTIDGAASQAERHDRVGKAMTARSQLHEYRLSRMRRSIGGAVMPPAAVFASACGAVIAAIASGPIKSAKGYVAVLWRARALDASEST